MPLFPLAFQVEMCGCIIVVLVTRDNGQLFIRARNELMHVHPAGRLSVTRPYRVFQIRAEVIREDAMVLQYQREEG